MPVSLALHCDRVPLDEARLERLIAAILQAEAPDAPPLRLSLCVVDDAESQHVNREFLQHDYPTDVISFDLREGEEAAELEDDVDGELVVNADHALREAAERDHGPEAELLLYVAHGLLHLLGYDDASPDDREHMMVLQTRYLAEVGIAIAS